MQSAFRSGSIAALALLWSVATAAAAHTSTDVYEARAYRVDQASGGQSAFAPLEVNDWGFDDLIPYSARQADLLLTPGDPLAVWFPSSGSATSTGGTRTYVDRMPQVDLATNTVSLDRYYRLESFLAPQVLVGAQESGYWIGSLPVGDYEFVLNDWSLPGVEAGLGGPSGLPTPWQQDLPKATLAGTVRWTFSVVPEPSAAVLSLVGLWAFGCPRR